MSNNIPNNLLSNYPSKSYNPKNDPTDDVAVGKNVEAISNSDKKLSTLKEVKDEYTPSLDLHSLFYKKPRPTAMSSMMEDMKELLTRSVIIHTITRTLEKYGVKLSGDDVISISIDGNGVFSIDVQGSSIAGKSGDDISSVCGKISQELNTKTMEDGSTFGSGVLSYFTEQLGLDPKTTQGNPDFKISFQLKYDSKTDKNVIMGVNAMLLNKK
ncbi:MAG: hypothetical protein LBQ66_16835 [Planctomycetaceae bacterium]|jgi:hypothetical protein|nr:hypothetical protein [Planctomycetaceae bacterium]